MAAAWPALAYGAWSATCDTLHAHTQVLGKQELLERLDQLSAEVVPAGPRASDSAPGPTPLEHTVPR